MRPVLLFCATGLLGLSAALSAAEPKIADTRAALEKWVETRQMISRVEAEWQADKDTLEQTRSLLQRELKAVEEQRSKLTTNSAAAEKEWAENEEARKVSTEALERARQFAAEFEGKLAKLVPRLPAPLQDLLKPLLNRLPADSASTKMGVSERMQVIVGILNEVDKFNSAVTVFTEKRKNDTGEEVAVETVYLGLGAAYFVNDSGDFAGLGTAGDAGWEWSLKPELAASVREAIRIYRNERAARFIPLPATVR